MIVTVFQFSLLCNNHFNLSLSFRLNFYDNYKYFIALMHFAYSVTF